MSTRSDATQQAILVILDGWGYKEEKEHNAIAAANTPVFDKLWSEYPHAFLQASGLAVGLPEGQMGNSEVGHMTIGAGTSLDQDLVRISKAANAGELGKIEAFQKLFAHVKKNNSVLHVQGLVSDGGVHSHIDHLLAFIRLAKAEGINKLAVHVFTDGRDTAPQSASAYIQKLEETLAEVGIGFIATISGRFYAMDRDNNWDRLSKAEQAMFECKGNVCTTKPSQYVSDLYKEGKLDEHLEPFVCHTPDGKGCAIEKGDGVFFFNFRADRARMLTEKILERQEKDNLLLVTLTEYSPEYGCLVAFPPLEIQTTLAKEISEAGLTQAHIAETEKFPHATYFLNGGKEEPYDNEEHILVPSRKDVPTHDLAPEMRAKEIADKVIESLEKGTDFVFVNFANPDMVGHTANVPAIITAIETVDRELGRVFEKAEEVGAVMFITADHGNAELNFDVENNVKHTAHTTNLVPAIITDKNLKLKDGALYDIAPTILNLMGLPKPTAMMGENLIS
jgi:2,3-bisphosphoglycerate-independent phosphoglycerate mutase